MEFCRTEEEKQQTLQANQQNAEAAVKAFEEMLEETKNPMEVQKQVLFSLLEDNKDTEFGRKYNFADIHTIEDYQKALPVSVWEDFEPWVQRMIDGEQNILTAYPFDHFNITSGTSGKPKFVAYTERHQNAYVKYNSMCGTAVLVNTIGTDWCRGRAFSPNTGELFTLPSGLTYGHIPAKIVDYMGGPDNADPVMRTTFTSPIEAGTTMDGRDTRYIHCRFALEDRDVTGINVMYFPLLLTMLEYIDKNYELLINDIEKGTISDEIKMPDDIRESLLKKTRPMPERAAELREIFKDGTDFPYLPVIWPDLMYIYGCKGGSFASYDRIMRDRYTGENLTRIYYGVTSTEGIYSTPYEADSDISVLTPGSLFMEFLPVEADGDFSKIVTMDKLEEGKQYEFVITNNSGLYRYRMSDSFIVVGKLNETPTIRFVGRVNKTMNMSSEKVLESDIEIAVTEVSEELNMPIFDFCVCPDFDNMCYRFLVEPQKNTELDMKAFADLLEKKLSAVSDVYLWVVNGLKTLNPLSLQRLQQDTCLLYLEMRAFKGASASTTKPVHVVSTDAQQNFFTSMVEGPVFTATPVSMQGEAEEPSDPSVLRIPLEGRLDPVNAPKFEEWLKSGLDGVEELILDMKDLEYVSSSGLRVLLQAQKIMSERRGMKIVNVNDEVMNTFKMTGFDEVLTIE